MLAADLPKSLNVLVERSFEITLSGEPTYFVLIPLRVWPSKAANSFVLRLESSLGPMGEHWSVPLFMVLAHIPSGSRQAQVSGSGMTRHPGRIRKSFTTGDAATDLLRLSACLFWNFRPLICVVVRVRRLHEVSPRLEARVAGVLYLFSILLGVVAMIFISRKMQVQGDQANLVAGVLYTGLTVLLWDLFRPVDEWVSTGAAIFSLAGCWLAPSWYKTAHISNFLFFGVYCLLIGYLILRSRFFPSALGVLMACAGVCWLTTTWPWLAHTISPYTTIVGLVGEGTFMGYLLVKGLDERRWREEAKLA